WGAAPDRLVAADRPVGGNPCALRPTVLVELGEQVGAVDVDDAHGQAPLVIGSSAHHWPAITGTASSTAGPNVSPRAPQTTRTTTSRFRTWSWWRGQSTVRARATSSAPQ